MTWTGAFNMIFDQGAVINNNGAWDVRVSQTMDWQAGTVAVFNNNGTFTKSTNTGTFTVEATFNNSGTVNVERGHPYRALWRDELRRKLLQSCGYGYLYFGASSSSPSTPGHTIDGTVEGAGSVRFWAGNATMSGPYSITGATTVDPSGSSAGRRRWSSMSNVSSLGNLALGNYGSLTIDGSAPFTHNYNVTVSPLSGYKLTVNLPSFVVKGTYQQTGGTLAGTYAGGAVFEVQGAATLSGGTISGGSLADKFKASGALSLTPSFSVHCPGARSRLPGPRRGPAPAMWC